MFVVRSEAFIFVTIGVFEMDARGAGREQKEE